MIRSTNGSAIGKMFGLLVILAILGFAMPLNGAAINYGTYVGDTVTFVDVTEDSITDPTPLFGAPLAVDDALVFSPTGFGATTSGGGVDITDGLLKMMMVAHAGQHIESIDFSERGDYTLAGVGTAVTQVSATLQIFVTVLEIDGVAVTPVTLTYGSPVTIFTPGPDGSYNLVADGGIGIIWTASVSIDLSGDLAALGIDFLGGATKANVSLDNTLLAISQHGSVAFIQKKQFDGVGIIVTTIPEPMTLSMLALGTLALIRRRRVAC